MDEDTVSVQPEQKWRLNTACKLGESNPEYKESLFFGGVAANQVIVLTALHRGPVKDHFLGQCYFKLWNYPSFKKGSKLSIL